MQLLLLLAWGTVILQSKDVIDDYLLPQMGGNDLKSIATCIRDARGNKDAVATCKGDLGDVNIEKQIQDQAVEDTLTAYRNCIATDKSSASKSTCRAQQDMGKLYQQKAENDFATTLTSCIEGLNLQGDAQPTEEQTTTCRQNAKTVFVDNGGDERVLVEVQNNAAAKGASESLKTCKNSAGDEKAAKRACQKQFEVDFQKFGGDGKMALIALKETRLSFKDDLAACISTAEKDREAIMACNDKAQIAYEQEGGDSAQFRKDLELAQGEVLREEFKYCLEEATTDDQKTTCRQEGAAKKAEFTGRELNAMQTSFEEKELLTQVISESILNCVEEDKTVCKNTAKTALLAAAGQEKDFAQLFDQVVTGEMMEVRNRCMEVATSPDEKVNCKNEAKEVFEELGGSEATFLRSQRRGIQKDVFDMQKTCMSDITADDALTDLDRESFARECRTLATDYAATIGVDVSQVKKDIRQGARVDFSRKLTSCLEAANKDGAKTTECQVNAREELASNGLKMNFYKAKEDAKVIAVKDEMAQCIGAATTVDERRSCRDEVTQTLENLGSSKASVIGQMAKVTVAESREKMIELMEEGQNREQVEAAALESFKKMNPGMNDVTAQRKFNTVKRKVQESTILDTLLSSDTLDTAEKRSAAEKQARNDCETMGGTATGCQKLLARSKENYVAEVLNKCLQEETDQSVCTQMREDEKAKLGIQDTAAVSDVKSTIHRKTLRLDYMKYCMAEDTTSATECESNAEEEFPSLETPDEEFTAVITSTISTSGIAEDDVSDKLTSAFSKVLDIDAEKIKIGAPTRNGDRFDATITIRENDTDKAAIADDGLVSISEGSDDRADQILTELRSRRRLSSSDATLTAELPELAVEMTQTFDDDDSPSSASEQQEADDSSLGYVPTTLAYQMLLTLALLEAFCIH